MSRSPITRRRTGLLALALAAALPLSACGSSEPAAETGDPMTATDIRIDIEGGQTLEARLWDNPAAQDLIGQLPLTLDFSDYGGQEVLAEPPQPLTMEGMPSGESAPAGTIGWYNPGSAIVLYYTDVGQFNGIVRIGEMDGDLTVLQGWDGARSVTIELAD